MVGRRVSGDASHDVTVRHHSRYSCGHRSPDANALDPWLYGEPQGLSTSGRTCRSRQPTPQAGVTPVNARSWHGPKQARRDLHRDFDQPRLPRHHALKSQTNVGAARTPPDTFITSTLGSSFGRARAPSRHPLISLRSFEPNFEIQPNLRLPTSTDCYRCVLFIRSTGMDNKCLSNGQQNRQNGHLIVAATVYWPSTSSNPLIYIRSKC